MGICSCNESITLEKDSKMVMPISVNQHRRVLLIAIEDTKSQLKVEGFYFDSYAERFADKLQTNGFEETHYDPKKNPMGVFIGPTYTMKKDFDLVIYLANLPSANLKPTLRLLWSPLFAADLPWFIQKVTTIFDSLANPYHLFRYSESPGHGQLLSCK
ncbi:MAG: hypothetical protein ACQEWV_32170 [Bacillota bacterium]